MKVDNPRFDHWGHLVLCEECPFNDDLSLCGDNECPTAELYESACRLAEQADKGEK